MKLVTTNLKFIPPPRAGANDSWENIINGSNFGDATRVFFVFDSCVINPQHYRMTRLTKCSIFGVQPIPARRDSGCFTRKSGHGRDGKTNVREKQPWFLALVLEYFVPVTALEHSSASPPQIPSYGKPTSSIFKLDPSALFRQP